MSSVSEAIAYTVGAIATVVAIGLFLAFFAFILVFLTCVAALAGLVILVLHWCGIDVREEVNKRL